MSAAPSRFTSAPGRWQLSRLGAINVWQYVNETFEAEHGRLLLFGSNGSGKTMLLEFTLPYLLDGRGSQARLSTSGGTERGGLWERVVGNDGDRARPGYLWAEFVHTGTGGHFVVGTRLQAKPSGGGDHTWFVTSRRPGHDLNLVDPPTRTPLGVDELERQIGESGTVFRDGSSRYRDTVRETLYPEMNPAQFDQLIDTLLIVRRKNVSEQLDPRRLNELLSAGLPPLDPNELRSVASGFEELDKRREHIEELEEDHANARRLERAVSAYARQVMAGVHQRALATERERRAVTDRRNDAERDHTDTIAKRDATRSSISQLKDRRAELRGQYDAWNTPEYREQAEQLEAASRRHKELDRDASDKHAEAAKRREAAVRERDSANARRSEADAAHETAASRARDTRELLRGVASLSSLVDDTADDDLPGVLRPVLAVRRENVGRVRSLLATRREKQTVREGAEETLERDVAKVEERESRLGKATTLLEEAATTWRSETGFWLGRLEQLDRHVLDGIEFEDPRQAADTVDRHHRDVVATQTHGRTIAQAELDAHDEQRTALQQRRAELEAGTDPEPEAPSWRSARDGRQGAPLWRLLNPAADLPSDALDRIEAAMTAAGLLDAWVHPDGHIELAEHVADALIITQTAVEGPSLADLLQPAADAPAHLADWLATVPTGGDGPVRISTDGTFRLGPLTGRGPARPARHLGAAAQAANRAAEIAQIDQQLDELSTSSAAARQRLDAAVTAISAADRDRDALPSTQPLDDADEALRTAQALLDDAEDDRDASEKRLRNAEEELERATIELRRGAADHDLPADPDGLEAADAQVSRIEQSLNGVAAAVQQARSDTNAAADADRRASDAESDAADTEQAAEAADGASRQAHATYQAIQERSGKDVAQVRAKLDEIEDSLRKVETGLDDAQKDLEELAEQVGAAEKELAQATEKYEAAEQARNAALQVLVEAIADGIAADAGFDYDGPLDNVAQRREADRRLGTFLDGETHSHKLLATRRTAVGTAATAMRQSAVVSFDPSDRGSWELLTVSVDGQRISAAALDGRIAANLERARDELTAHQEELFKRTLTGSVREHLASRIRAANDHTAQMNELLAQVRTETGGVSAQLRWRVDGNVDDATLLRRARDLLVRSVIDPAERAELNQFLERQIERARAAESENVSWQDRLESALDYRAWHRFDLYIEHERHDEPLLVTSKRLELSTGETSVALTLPLIAAVVAYYLPPDQDSPPRTCPRLLLMDELFPTLDPDNKRMLLGLLNNLDLDVVFTSDKDQCHYSTIDAIAIHHVHRDTDRWAISTRSVWNGREVVDAPATQPTGQPILEIAGG